jgi:hypothetical protein
MLITIVSGSEFLVSSKSAPAVGHTYSLEDTESGTGAQSRAFHALLSCYYVSGLWSYQGSGYNQGATLSEFRDLVKRKLGVGFETFFYAEIDGDGKARARKVKTWQDVPEGIRHDPRVNEMVFGRLKSWADYTKRERMDTMDKLIKEMHQVGVTSQKFMDILEGMEAFK